MSFKKNLYFVLLAVQMNLSAFSMETDGSAMDPSSYTQNVEVAIVGGGIAGLMTAHYLKNHKLNFHVFEARNRLGGRVNTHYFNTEKTQYYEEGGTTIDADHHDTIKLAKDLNVPLSKIGMGDGKLSVICNGQEVDADSLAQALKESAEFFDQQWSSIKDDVNKLLTYEEKVGWCYNSFSPVLELCQNQIAKAFWKTYIQDECGINYVEAPITFLAWLKEKASEFNTLVKSKNSSWIPTFAINQFAYSYQVEGGMSCLVEALKRSIEPSTKINYGHILKQIHKQDALYYLTFDYPQGQKTIIAEKVVMTIPFSTLRDVNIDSSVGLTPLQIQAIQMLPYGTNGKIGVPVNDSFSMLYHINLDQQFDAWPGQRALTIMLGGNAGANLTQGVAEELVSTEHPILQNSYPAIGTIGQPVIKNWTQDPFSKGSYSAMRSNVNVDLWNQSNNPSFSGMRQFAENTPDNAFIFAGEHTRADGSASHIEGAVRSGISAAKLLLN